MKKSCSKEIPLERVERKLKSQNLPKGAGRAEDSGRVFEKESVLAPLKHFGFEEMTYKEVEGSLEKELPDRVITPNAPYTNVKSIKSREYGHNPLKEMNGRTEFSITAYDVNENRLTEAGYLNARIECKFQNVTGTAKEKIANTILNMKMGDFPERTVIFVVGGKYIDKTEVAMFQDMADNLNWRGTPSNRRNIVFYTLPEWISWCNETFVVKEENKKVD